MQPVLIHNATKMALADVGPVGVPLGQPMEIRAGDAVFFPPNSRGVWDVKEAVRKTYVTFVY